MTAAHSEFAQGLAEVLNRVWQTLTPDLLMEEELNPLREAERFLEKWQEQRPEDTDLRFLCFFLDAYLAKVFCNFTHEIPLAGPVVPIMEMFVSELKLAFAGMVLCLCEAKYPDLHPFYIYKRMGLAYLTAVDKLNQVL